MKHIVIVTNTNDRHADDMILMLGAMGYEAHRLNSNFIPLYTTLHFSLQERAWTGDITIELNKRRIDIEDIRSIWWRRPDTFPLPANLPLQEQEFARKEIDHALSGLWAGLDCYWVSHPQDIRHANWKMEQLQRASQLGFEVPRTIVTNDIAQALIFYEACHSQMIFKVLSDPFLAVKEAQAKQPDQPAPKSRGTYTTLLTEDKLAHIESLQFTPCLFQEYIPKRLELRVTVIGDEVFAAEIHSQVDAKTSIDWRHYEVDIPYRKATLPIDVAERCLKLVRSYSLNFSTMDLIVTPDDRYVFIENNPNGQFMFIEKRVPELPMTAALAACLIRGANS